MMTNIVVTPEVNLLDRSIKHIIIYIVKRIDVNFEPVILIYNKENNILYEYMNDKNRDMV